MARRVTIETASVPLLAKHVKLRHDTTRGCWVLLAPERVMVPDEVALAILQRLDGTASVGGIAQALAKEYDADPEEIAADVRDMLQDLADKGFIRV